MLFYDAWAKRERMLRHEEMREMRADIREVRGLLVKVGRHG